MDLVFAIGLPPIPHHVERVARLHPFFVGGGFRNTRKEEFPVVPLKQRRVLLCHPSSARGRRGRVLARMRLPAPSHLHNQAPRPPKKPGTPLPPSFNSAEKMIGPIIFKTGRGGLFCSNNRTCGSPGTSGEKGWSVRPYLIWGRTDRSQIVVGATIDPRGFEIAPTPLPCSPQKN
jgi:hypothetical protein